MITRHISRAALAAVLALLICVKAGDTLIISDRLHSKLEAVVLLPDSLAASIFDDFPTPMNDVNPTPSFSKLTWTHTASLGRVADEIPWSLDRNIKPVSQYQQLLIIIMWAVNNVTETSYRGVVQGTTLRSDR